MSHMVNIVTQIKDRAALVRSLERMGFKGKIEVHDAAQNLIGYQGDKRADKAHVIIRKQHVGTASNDIGFEQGADGRFIAHISEYDQGTGQYPNKSAKYGQVWQHKLNTYYGVEKAKLEFEKQGMKYTEDVDEQERPRLRVRV